MQRNRLTSFALHAAFAGLAAGATLLTGCPSDSKASTEKNACNGPNGCGSKENEKAQDTNACKGHDGCNAKDGEKAGEKNACKGHDEKKANG
jgi:hypothetical protein